MTGIREINIIRSIRRTNEVIEGIVWRGNGKNVSLFALKVPFKMIGFTEEEVRQMLTYYSTTSPFNHSIDELIEIMKPWYDNYCFAEECYGETTMYNSNMVLYFVKNYIQRGKAPREMVEDNIRIDYEKLRMLIRKDKEFAHDASIIQTLVSQGYITGELKKGFPAVNITNPNKIHRQAMSIFSSARYWTSIPT